MIPATGVASFASPEGNYTTISAYALFQTILDGAQSLEFQEAHPNDAF